MSENIIAVGYATRALQLNLAEQAITEYIINARNRASELVISKGRCLERWKGAFLPKR